MAGARATVDPLKNKPLTGANHRSVGTLSPDLHQEQRHSLSKDKRYRTTHHKRTKQRGNGQQQQRSQDSLTWERDLDYVTTWDEIDRWSVDPGSVPEAVWDSLEQCEEGYQRMELARRSRKPERQPQKCIGGGDTGIVAKSGRRPAPTSRAYQRARGTGQAPCYAVRHTVSLVHVHSPVRYIAAPHIGRARVGIWSPVRLLGPVYMAPALRMVSPLRQHSPVRAIPPRHTGLATGSIQPGKVGQARCSRAPVRLHGPDCPVLPPRTIPLVAAPRTRLSLRLLPTGAPACPALPESPVCPELPGAPACPALPEPSSCPELLELPVCPEPSVSQELPEPSVSPELPEPPATPTMPESPFTPEMPESSDCPALPESSFTPALPESPVHSGPVARVPSPRSAERVLRGDEGG